MKIIFTIFVLVSASMAFADKAATRGTGPIHIECTDSKGQLTVYNVNTVYFTGNSDKKLIANGFGPNKGDEGFATLTGDCEIHMAATPAE